MSEPIQPRMSCPVCNAPVGAIVSYEEGGYDQGERFRVVDVVAVTEHYQTALMNTSTFEVMYADADEWVSIRETHEVPTK